VSGLHRNISYGWIDVITSGSMYAGKTTELIRRVRNFVLAKRSATVYQPRIAERFAPNQVVSHDGLSWEAVQTDNPTEILWHAELNQPSVVAIDEVQFYDPSIVDVVQELANRGHYVICAGLSQTSEGKPFGSMPQLLAIADAATSLYGVCVSCGEPATKAFALQVKTQDVSIGAGEKYEARCRKCWLEGRRARAEMAD
jgi:thymidine kinase